MVTVGWDGVIMEALDKSKHGYDEPGLTKDFRLALYVVTYHRGGIEEARIRQATIDVLPENVRKDVEKAWHIWYSNKTLSSYNAFMRKAVGAIKGNYDHVTAELKKIPVENKVKIYQR